MGKDDAKPRDTYHHGNLPVTLVQETAVLLAERGVEGFSMREVARRAGVAVAAPSNHFGNAKGLLTAVAAEGFARLSRQMELAVEDHKDPVERTIAVCQAYVDMRVRNPGHGVIMFRLDLLDEENVDIAMHAFQAFRLLMEAIAHAAPDGIDPKEIEQATKTLWSTTHGLIALTMIEEREARELIRFAVSTLIEGMRSRQA